MSIIRNIAELFHGNVEGRKAALEIIEHAIATVNAYEAVRKIIRLDEDMLRAGHLNYELSEINNIYVLGAGKASFEIAEALEDTLEDRIRDGVIIEKAGRGRTLKKIRVIEAGHPVPDERGLQGARKIVGLAEKADEGDLVFVAITGGCSALMPLPAEGMSLEDKREVTELLLNSGASIDEINTVRKHLSAVKGGRLAINIHPAEIINLIVIDEVAGKPWGPTIPDGTTFEDAKDVLKRHSIWEKTPNNVKKFIEYADQSFETPKEDDFKEIGIKSETFILADNNLACEAALAKARELGFNASILTTVMEGESKEVGRMLSAVAREIERHGRPLEPPCVIISGGETTVTIEGEAGEGGRNQELVLSASQYIKGSEAIVIASIGTDGTDGPTEIAGAIADGHSVERASGQGLDIKNELQMHNSSPVFRKLGDAIFTGPTGTNVMDLQLIVVLSRA